MLRFTRKRVVLLFIGLVFLGLVLFALVFGLFFISPAAKDGADQIVVIQEGLSLNEVSLELKRRGIVSNQGFFLYWANIKGFSRKIKAGEYRLSARMTPAQIFEILTKGMIITHPVTIPEGFTRMQIAKVLEEKGLVEKEAFLRLTDNPAPLKAYNLSAPTLEGYLYPDTYHFGRGISSKKVIEAMMGRFWQVAGPLVDRVAEVGLTMEDVITLASIVEKETGQGEERPLIAAVFLNRLKKGMRLESDPTVIYGLDNFDGNLKRKDLTAPSPYNTYVIRGLPPGPIASPGIEAIKAVLYPAQSKYLYFVSKNDGFHQFSETLAEHNRAVSKYQKKRRKRR